MSQPRLIEMRFVLNRERQIPEALRQETSETAKAKRKKVEKKLAVGLEGKNLQELKKQQE